MKKLIYACALLIGAVQTSCMMPGYGVQGTNPSQVQTQQQGAGQDLLSVLLASLANNAVTQTEQYSGQQGNFLGNLLASVTGNYTTTQNNIVGTWVYNAPCVQFESQNLLTQAGGATAATKIESYLTDIYKKVNINPGTMTFTFQSNGQVSFNIGNKQGTGTYTFDNASKTVTITGSQYQRTITAYVTISGTNMSLCFDTSKALELFSTFGQQYSASTSVSTLAAMSQYFTGMKTGFKFTKK